MLKKLFSLYTV